MRFALRTLFVAAALAFGATQFASASLTPNVTKMRDGSFAVNSPRDVKPILTAEGLTKMGDGSFAVISPQHQLFFVRKAGAPGVLAKPGTYKLANGHLVTVGKGGVVTDSKSWTQFTDPGKLAGGANYYR